MMIDIGRYSTTVHFKVLVQNSQGQSFTLNYKNFQVIASPERKLSTCIQDSITPVVVPPNDRKICDGYFQDDQLEKPASLTITYTFDNGYVGSVTMDCSKIYSNV
jgi:hypothetical protein